MSVVAVVTVTKGDSIDLSIDLTKVTGLDTTQPYTQTWSIVETAGYTTVDAGGSFIGSTLHILPSVTQDIAAGTYLLRMVVTQSTTYRKTSDIKLTIEE